MKFNCYFTLRGPGGETEVPAKDNPIDCDDLESLLIRMSTSLPAKGSMGIQTIGLRITKADSVPEPKEA